MAKHNKVRYQSKPKARVAITLTGVVFLQYADEEKMADAKKGDLLLYPYNDALHTNRFGEYEATGFTGYFKLDVHDGNTWKPVLLADIFTSQEHYFSKKERPLDTYNLCAELLRARAGQALTRTYREHYQPENSVEEE